jgi:outer membrane lipoprotein SlyB
MRRLLAVTFTACFLLTACHPPSQNNYGEADVGHTAIIAYGIVKSARPVDITGQNSGGGAGVGAIAGGLAGSTIGRGNGSILGLVGGAIIGGIAGAAAEQALKDRQGIEYIIKFQNGNTESVVQNIAKSDRPIAAGQCVMVQFGTNYQRVLPDDDEEDCRPVKAAKKHHRHKDDDEDQAD